VYVLLSTTDLRKNHKAALHRLIKTLCMLQRKRWTLADLEELQGEVLKAICMVEAYLPVDQRNIQLHALRHLPLQHRASMGHGDVGL
jgi:hypothetical protein